VSKKKYSIVYGDLLSQDVQLIVNPWNRNIIPYWLLIPQGVSGAIRKKAGKVPYRELVKVGIMQLGSAVLTTAGDLPFKGIIHVAGINLFWRATEDSIRTSTRNALKIANAFSSIAFPLIGAGTGSYPPDKVQRFMIEEFANSDYSGDIILTIFNQKT